MSHALTGSSKRFSLEFVLWKGLNFADGEMTQNVGMDRLKLRLETSDILNRTRKMCVTYPQSFAAPLGICKLGSLCFRVLADQSHSAKRMIRFRGAVNQNATLTMNR